MTKYINLFFQKDKVALSFLVAFSCILGAILRFDEFWDFHNYHYYNAWAFLNDRLNVDVVPAFGNTYFSPFADIPLYFLANALNHHPVIFSVILAVPFGLNLFLIYKISTLFFSKDEVKGRIKICMTLLLCLCSTNILSQISSSSHDSSLTVLILTGVYLVLKDIFVERKFLKRTYLIAGFSIGIAVGLKLTFAPYAVASGLTVFLFFKKLNHPVKTIFLFGSAMFAGFLISYGYWGWILWKNYQNPIFPFFNRFIPSVYWEGQYIDFRDHRYFRKSGPLLLLYPFFMFYNFNRTFPIELLSGWCVSNLRYCLAYVTFFWLVLTKTVHPRLTASKQTFVVVWAVLIYIVWIALFRVERYLLPFEFLLNLMLVDHFFPDEKLVLKSVRSIVFLIFIIAIPVLLPFPIFYRPLYSRAVSYPLLPDPHPLPENSLIALYGPPTSSFVPFLATDNSTPAILNPTLEAEINGSDFFVRGYFDKKRKELFETWVNHPERDIYYITMGYSVQETFISKDENGKYVFQRGEGIPCRGFFTILYRGKPWKFYLCRQSLKNADPNQKFSNLAEHPEYW